MKRFSVVLMFLVSMFPSAGFALDIMPDFSNVPTGWTTDRYAPNSFSTSTFAGRNNVLGIGISSSDGLNNRPSGYQNTFYNTQGMQHAISGGSGSGIYADLYIPTAWNSANNGTVRTDMWGVMTNGSSVTDYPIIGFTNYGGNARFRIWDGDTINGWVDINSLVNYDAWTTLSIDFTGSAYDYSINGALVYEDTTINGSTGFSATIMQAYNFSGDPSLGQVNPVNYVAEWSNTTTPTPEPGTMLLMGIGAAGMVFMRRRKIRNAN